MPSLLCVAPVDHPGGAEIGLLRLLPRLRARGWETTLTTPGPGPLRDAARDLGIPWEPLPLGGLRRGSGTRAVLSYGRARRLVDDVDAVYLNGGVTGRLLPALRGTPAALHIHDLVDRVPGFWRSARLLLADSSAVAARMGALAPRTEVVGCPIEREPVSVPAPWPADGRPVVGYVGRIEPRKGVLDLVHAAPRLREAGARVVLVGDDPYRSDPDYLEEVLAGEGIEHYGWVSNASGLMGELDVLVLPSRAEPFGTVLAEAMNAGTPVVATAGTGGLAEVVEDGVTGRLVAPGDVDALVAATLEVLSRKEEMGAAGRERAKRWHAGVYAERISDLLTAMLRVVPVHTPS